MKTSHVICLATCAAIAACQFQNDDVDQSKRSASGIIRQAPKQKAPKLIKTKQKIKLSNKEFDCLARNVFHEAGVESTEGKIAVAQVTLNRVESRKWGQNVCDVVYSKSQFSWTKQKHKRNSIPKGKLWEDSIKAVHEFEAGTRVKELKNSLFYHTDYIKMPAWADANQVLTKVGQHIFYADAKKS